MGIDQACPEIIVIPTVFEELAFHWTTSKLDFMIYLAPLKIHFQGGQSSGYVSMCPQRFIPIGSGCFHVNASVNMKWMAAEVYCKEIVSGGEMAYFESSTVSNDLQTCCI